ncbi:hypothetical protein MRX96_050833 [Rhipicephalus microplus]
MRSSDRERTKAGRKRRERTRRRVRTHKHVCVDREKDVGSFACSTKTKKKKVFVAPTSPLTQVTTPFGDLDRAVAACRTRVQGWKLEMQKKKEGKRESSRKVALTARLYAPNVERERPP